jgi:hypothetical protein
MLTQDHIRWAYRLWLDREPENRESIDYHIERSPDVPALRNAFLLSHEFRGRNGVNTFADKEIIYETPHGVRMVLNLGDRGVSCVVLDDAFEPAETAFVVGHCLPGTVASTSGRTSATTQRCWASWSVQRGSSTPSSRGWTSAITSSGRRRRTTSTTASRFTAARWRITRGRASSASAPDRTSTRPTRTTTRRATSPPTSLTRTTSRTGTCR